MSKNLNTNKSYNYVFINTSLKKNLRSAETKK